MNNDLCISFTDCCRPAGTVVSFEGCSTTVGQWFGFTPFIDPGTVFSVLISRLNIVASGPFRFIRDDFAELVISVTAKEWIHHAVRTVRMVFRTLRNSLKPNGKEFFTLMNRLRI